LEIYGGLDPTLANEAREAANYVRERQERSATCFIEIGHKLYEVKGKLGHGKFLDWLNGEFSMSERTAHVYMWCAAFAKKYPDRKSEIAQLPITMILLIADKTVSKDARTKILDKHASGEKVTTTEASAIIAEHPPEPAAKPRKPVKDERKSVEATTRARRLDDRTREGQRTTTERTR
jgi:hypothetical protein